ncbi:MAG: tetratricopeptide repeat protein, partial [Bacteroidetes bacterium]|nr:tetratricopeptide repeat protein [Bacteroidota bacterium]
MKNYLINALTLCLFVGSLPLFGQNATLEEGISAYDQGREYYLASNFDSAEYFFLIALDIYKKQGNDTLLGDCYHNLGTTYEQKKDYPQAFNFIRKGLEIRRKVYGNEKEPVGVSYRGIGNIHLDMGNYDSAIYYYEIVEPIFEKDTSSSQETKSILLSNLGSLHQEKANYEKALDYHLRALEIRRELFEEESFQIAASYNNLANTYSDLGEYEKSMNYYQKSLKIKQKVLDPDHPSLASSFNNLGSAYQLIGEDQLALENYEKALEIRKMIFPENHPYLGRSYYNIASIFLNLSEYQKALEAFDQATEIWLSSLGEENPYTSMGFHGVGMAQIELKQYDQALINTKKALDITLATFGKNHPSVIQIYQTLGEVYTRSKRFPEALELYEEAVLLQINLFGPEHSFLATIYKNMGDVYLEQGNLELAIKYFKDAAGIETQNFGNHHPDLAETYLNLADIYTRLKDCETADSYFQQAFEANVKSFSGSSDDDLPDPESAALNSTILLETIEEKANFIETCLENGPEKLHKLANIYDRAIRVLDKMISSYRSEEALLALQAKSRGIYEKAIRVMMDLYNQDHKEEYLEKALIYAEKGKASRFNQLFRASYAQSLTSVPMEIIDYEKSLGKKLAFYEEERLSAEMDQDSGRITKLNATIFSLHQSYDSLLKVIRERHSDYYQIVYSPEVADRHLIEKNLPSGAGFVEYFWGEEALYVFVLDGKHIFLKSLPLPRVEQILKMRQSIYSYYLQSDSIFGVHAQHSTPDNWKEMGRYFYQELIEKVITDLPERLVIVPDGALGYLPFETFTDQDGQYLVSKTAISYAYSATHFCQL